MYPENFRYTKEHEWVMVEGDTATIGITDHAQHELGDIVYVDLPKVGATLEAARPSARWNRSRPSPTSTRPSAAKSRKSTPHSPMRPKN